MLKIRGVNVFPSQIEEVILGFAELGPHYEIIVDVKGFKWMIQTTDFHAPGDEIGIKLNPDDIHIMKKSEYSGKFGDYSSYSEEYDKLDDATILNDDSESEVID